MTFAGESGGRVDAELLPSIRPSGRYNFCTRTPEEGVSIPWEHNPENSVRPALSH